MKNLFFILLIISFLSCKEHSVVDPVVNQESSFVIPSDTIRAKVIVLDNDGDDNPVIFSSYSTGYASILKIENSYSILIPGHLSMRGNLEVNGDDSYIKSLSDRISMLENKIAELESKLDSQNF